MNDTKVSECKKPRCFRLLQSVSRMRFLRGNQPAIVFQDGSWKIPYGGENPMVAGSTDGYVLSMNPLLLIIILLLLFGGGGFYMGGPVYGGGGIGLILLICLIIYLLGGLRSRP